MLAMMSGAVFPVWRAALAASLSVPIGRAWISQRSIDKNEVKLCCV